MTDMSTAEENLQTTNVEKSAGEVRAPTVWPSLQARDALALIDFYVETFGFLRTAVYRDGDRLPTPSWTGPKVAASCSAHTSRKPNGAASREPFGAYVVTDQVDDVYPRVKASGATIKREVAEPSYGSREFSSDPEGNPWSFGTYRAEPRS